MHEEPQDMTVISTGLNQSSDLKDLAAALSKAQSEIKGALKDSTNPHFKSKYADLASVWDAFREPFTKHGLSLFQSAHSTRDSVTVMSMLLHESGQYLRDSLTLYPSKGNDPQAMGSAITYGRRYLAAAMAGVCPEDDDGNAATVKMGDGSAGYISPEGPYKVDTWIEGIFLNYAYPMNGQPGKIQIKVADGEMTFDCFAWEKKWPELVPGDPMRFQMTKKGSLRPISQLEFLGGKGTASEMKPISTAPPSPEGKKIGMLETVKPSRGERLPHELTIFVPALDGERVYSLFPNKMPEGLLIEDIQGFIGSDVYFRDFPTKKGQKTYYNLLSIEPVMNEEMVNG